MTLLERLDYIVYKKGITYKEFFEKSGFPKSSYYSVKKGDKTSLRPVEANKIINAFPEFSYDWLMGKEEINEERTYEKSVLLDLAKNKLLGKAMLDNHNKLLETDYTYALWFDKEINVRALKLLKDMRQD